jgi:hypothetical protein
MFSDPVFVVRRCQGLQPMKAFQRNTETVFSYSGVFIYGLKIKKKRVHISVMHEEGAVCLYMATHKDSIERVHDMVLLDR